MNRRSSTLAWAAAALVLTIPATIGIATADSGLFRAEYVVDGVPITVIAPDDEVDRPAAVVVHGYAGSATIMDPLAVAIARAGYRVVLPDLSGHGSNTTPLIIEPSGRGRVDQLTRDVDVAVAWIARQNGVLPGQIGLVGHSMGAGAVVRYAVTNAQSGAVAATVALSLPSASDIPVGESTVPRNLMLMWGAAEPAAFTTAGEAGVRAAYPDAELGRDYGSAADGSARGTRVIPSVEHIGIVFSPVTAQQTVDWLDSTVAVGSSGHTVAPDARILWLIVLLVGAVCGFVPIARVLFGSSATPTPSVNAPVTPARWVPPIMIVAVVVATAVGGLLRDRSAVLPLSVADYLVSWFAVTGVVAGVGAWWIGRSHRPPKVAETAGVGRQVVATLVLTAYLVAVLALASQATWSEFAVVGPKRWVLPIVEVALLLFFWADERLVARPSRGRRLVLVTFTRVVVVVTLITAVSVAGAPGALVLWVPIMAILLVLLAACGHIVAGLTRERWAPAVVQAIPLAYVLVTALPIIAAG